MALAPVLNGHINLTTDGMLTVAKTTCNVGYTMYGADTLSCRTDGGWDYVQPSCGKTSYGYKFCLQILVSVYMLGVQNSIVDNSAGHDIYILTASGYGARVVYVCLVLIWFSPVKRIFILLTIICFNYSEMSHI